MIRINVFNKTDWRRLQRRKSAAAFRKKYPEIARERSRVVNARYRKSSVLGERASNLRYKRTHREKILKLGIEWDLKNPERHMLHVTKGRAKKRGIPFNLTIEDIVIPKRCPILGLVLVCGRGRGRSDNSPSIDKIIPSKGYVKGNVWVISWRANRIKYDATPDELMTVALAVKLKTEESCESY